MTTEKTTHQFLCGEAAERLSYALDRRDQLEQQQRREKDPQYAHDLRISARQWGKRARYAAERYSVYSACDEIEELRAQRQEAEDSGNIDLAQELDAKIEQVNSEISREQ